MPWHPWRFYRNRPIQKGLANALLVDRSPVVRVLDALQEGGFIERREGRPE